MKGSIALTYDFREANRFARKATGIDEATCVKVLESRDRFYLGLEILPKDDLHGLTAADLRVAHPAFFDPKHILQRLVDPRIECAFIMMDTGLSGSLVSAIIDADLEYMRKQGIID